MHSHLPVLFAAYVAGACKLSQGAGKILSSSSYEKKRPCQGFWAKKAEAVYEKNSPCQGLWAKKAVAALRERKFEYCPSWKKAMARVLAIVLSTLFLLAVSVSAARSFEETGYIDMVTDKIQNLESNFVKILGTNPKSLQFAEFAARYGKRYDSVRQIVQRFNVFVKNVELIESRNRMKLPYTLAINEFADITWEEFHGQYLGASQNCSATNSNHKLTYAQLPAEKDWRQEGIVSPVKNQAHCGSCWTFSTTGALEAAYTQATGKTVILSEQQLVDCAGAFNNFGCSGGLPSQAFEYIKYNGGLDTVYPCSYGFCYDSSREFYSLLNG